MGTTPLSAVDLKPYEGLIFTTARKFADDCGMELDDMRQELRLKAAQAVVAYDPKRSPLDLKKWVFGVIVNRVTDMRRSHLRRMSLGVDHIEDLQTDGSPDRFEFRYCSTAHEIVYGKIDEGTFVVPATLTDRQADVLRLLLLDYSRVEVATMLGVPAWVVYEAVDRLRVKLSDWRPDVTTDEGDSQSDTGSVVSVETPIAA